MYLQEVNSANVPLYPVWLKEEARSLFVKEQLMSARITIYKLSSYTLLHLKLTRGGSHLTIYSETSCTGKVTMA